MKESKPKSRKLKNLLVISSGFPDKANKHYISIFVKKQVIALSKYFDNIYVFAPYPFNPKLISGLTNLPPSDDFKDYKIFNNITKARSRNLSLRGIRQIADDEAISSEKRTLGRARDDSDKSDCRAPLGLAMTKICKLHNIHVFFPKYLDAPGTFSDRFRARRWYKMISRQISDDNIDFDVIHGHFTYPGGKVAQLLSTRYDRPYFVTVHENQDWLKRELSIPLKIRTNEIWRGAKKIFFVNKIGAEKLHRRYKNIEWLPNGVDTKRFHPIGTMLSSRPERRDPFRRKLHLPLDKTILLSVGSLIPIKNYQLLIRTVGNLAKTRPDIFCVIIGNGKQRSSLLQLAKQLSIQDKVMILPQLPNDQLPAWYNACDIYCVSSKRESFGITQLEAMACGKPVVATPNGGSQMVVVKTCGIISEGHDTASFTKSINIALGRRWVTRSIVNSAKRYDEATIVKKLAREYFNNLN